MNTQENLLNSEAQKCSFCEDDIENMCSNKEHDTYRSDRVNFQGQRDESIINSRVKAV